MQTTSGVVGVHGPRFIPVLFIALLVLAGAAAVVYGVAAAFAGPGSITGRLLQTTGNDSTAGSSVTQFCENQTSATG